jgi:hypothetical protein
MEIVVSREFRQDFGEVDETIITYMEGHGFRGSAAGAGTRDLAFEFEETPNATTLARLQQELQTLTDDTSLP